MPRSNEATYVVQRLRIHAPGEGVLWEAWEDVATVTVPAKSKRSTVIGKALQDAGLMPSADDPLRVRVLDARSAHVTTVALKQLEPQLEMS
jgi:hypothetical protein